MPPLVWTRSASHSSSPATVTDITGSAGQIDTSPSIAFPRSRYSVPHAISMASVDAGPGLATAEHAAKSAALNAEAVGTLQRDRGIIGAAAVRIENPAAPFGVPAGLHVDQNLFAIPVRFLVNRVAAKVGAALFYPDLAFLLFGEPKAERRVLGRDDRLRRGGGGGGPACRSGCDGGRRRGFGRGGSNVLPNRRGWRRCRRSICGRNGCRVGGRVGWRSRGRRGGSGNGNPRRCRSRLVRSGWRGSVSFGCRLRVRS